MTHAYEDALADAARSGHATAEPTCPKMYDEVQCSRRAGHDGSHYFVIVDAVKTDR